MTALLTLLGVITAGAAGALLRWQLSRLNSAEGFPLGTFAANVAGSFLLGLLTARGGPGLAILGTGLLGAFTTFSTFMNETVDRASKGQRVLAVSYVILSLVAGIAAATAGLRLG